MSSTTVSPHFFSTSRSIKSFFRIAIEPPQRKERLLDEIKDNQIDPEAIIGKDKKYLDEFDKRLEDIDTTSGTLSSEDFEKIDLEGTGLKLEIDPADEVTEESDEDVVEQDIEEIVEEEQETEDAEAIDKKEE